MNFVSASLDPVQYGILLVHYDIYYIMVFTCNTVFFSKIKVFTCLFNGFGISLICTCYLTYDNPNVIGGEKSRSTRGTGIESIV